MPVSKHQQGIPEERRQEIARRLFEAREDLGITQAELAHRVGCYHSTISRYETGDRIPSQRLFRSLALALGKSIPYLRASDWNGNEMKGGTDGEG